MLVLTRKINETIHVGEQIVIKVVKLKGNVVGLGIEAPDNVKIMRSELVARERALPESTPQANSKAEPSKSGPLGAFTIAG